MNYQNVPKRFLVHRHFNESRKDPSLVSDKVETSILNLKEVKL